MLLDYCRIEMADVMPHLIRLLRTFPRRAGANPGREPAAPFFRMPAAAVRQDTGGLIARLKSSIALSATCIEQAKAAGANPDERAFVLIRDLDTRRLEWVHRV